MPTSTLGFTLEPVDTPTSLAAHQLYEWTANKDAGAKAHLDALAAAGALQPHMADILLFAVCLARRKAAR